MVPLRLDVNKHYILEMGEDFTWRSSDDWYSISKEYDYDIGFQEWYRQNKKIIEILGIYSIGYKILTFLKIINDGHLGCAGHVLAQPLLYQGTTNTHA